MNISGMDGDIENWIQTWSISVPHMLGKKLMNFGPLTTMVRARMLTHFKSTLCILQILRYKPRNFATRGIPSF